MAPKKISAKELVADIKTGMTDDELMGKYGISDQSLQKLFQQLLDKGLVNESDMSWRQSKSARENKVAQSGEETKAYIFFATIQNRRFRHNC